VNVIVLIQLENHQTMTTKVVDVTVVDSAMEHLAVSLVGLVNIVKETFQYHKRNLKFHHAVCFVDVAVVEIVA